MAHILYMSTLLVVGLSTFSGLNWNSITNFISNKFNPPYIMLHDICKIH